LAPTRCRRRDEDPRAVLAPIRGVKVHRPDELNAACQ
jgi:hypothetical protein